MITVIDISVHIGTPLIYIAYRCLTVATMYVYEPAYLLYIVYVYAYLVLAQWQQPTNLNV